MAAARQVTASDERKSPGFGPGGRCLCQKCGYSEAHQPGVPCNSRRCPRCGIGLKRQEREANHE